LAVVTYVFRADDLEQELLVEMAGRIHDEVLIESLNVQERIEALIRSRADVNSPGGLASSVRRRIIPADDPEDDVLAVIFSDKEHALWFEEGTGIFGPRRSFIFPRFHKLMVFKPRGQVYGRKASKMRGFVFASKVEGQKGKHPFRDGLNQVVGQGGRLRRMKF
jgi:hypothetical protein